MDSLLVINRLVSLGIVAYWIVQIAIAARKPRDWRPALALTTLFRIPMSFTRNPFILAGVLGILAGTAVFAMSFVLFP